MERGDGQRSVLRLRDEVAYEESAKWRDKVATLEQVLKKGEGLRSRMGGLMAGLRNI